MHEKETKRRRELAGTHIIIMHLLSRIIHKTYSFDRGLMNSGRSLCISREDLREVPFGICSLPLLLENADDANAEHNALTSGQSRMVNFCFLTCAQHALLYYVKEFSLRYDIFRNNL